MASYVEKVLDLFEKLAVNPDIPKHLQEDINWAIDVISANKLYVGSFEGFKLSEDRPEIKAWVDYIGMKNLPQSKEEMLRLKMFDINLNEKEENKKRKNNTDMKKRRDQDNSMIDESRINLLN